jgi:acyl-CoA synthetase (AMP-forming)/AMP-acid ligase II
VTVLPGPPTLYQAILDHPAGTDHRPVHVCGWRSPVPPTSPSSSSGAWTTSCRSRPVITGYGLTEAGTAAATSPGDDVETIATTVGRPRPGFELRIADDAGST